MPQLRAAARGGVLVRGRGHEAPASIAFTSGAHVLSLLSPQRRGHPARMVVSRPRLRDLVPGRARHAHERGAEDGDRPACGRRRTRTRASRDARHAGRLMRLEPRPGERIDRSRPVTFMFQGRPVGAFEGDTIGSALFAGGQRVFSRSFKYHRKRGLLCCSGHCPNCMMQVEGVPNVRVCTEPVRQGVHVQAQNVLGSLDPHATRTHRSDVEHRRADVLVIGGGESGRAAAAKHAEQGKQVVLVDEDPYLDVSDADYEVLVPARALGVWEGGLVPVEAGDVLYRFRAEHVVVAAGALDQPLVFPGNDLIGVMLPGAVLRMIDQWALRPGKRAVVVTVDERGREAAERLRKTGIEIAGVYDLRRERVREIVARGRRGHLRSVELDGRRVDCDLLVTSGGQQPAYSLLAQAGAKVEYDHARGIFFPSEIPDGIEAVGAAAGEGIAGGVPAATYNGASAQDKCFVCICEDVTDKDVKRAIAEGFDSIELAKRYTTVTMGPCQGKLCHLPSIRLYARENETDEETIGTTTSRPPWAPVSLGLLAGRPHEPAQRTSIHHRHKELGARMMWTGTWRRPYSYGDDPRAEAQAVHHSVGLIDVSTLGKLLVVGPDAGAFLDRLYPNRFSDLAPGRIRYGVLGTD